MITLYFFITATITFSLVVVLYHLQSHHNLSAVYDTCRHVHTFFPNQITDIYWNRSNLPYLPVKEFKEQSRCVHQIKRKELIRHINVSIRTMCVFQVCARAYCGVFACVCCGVCVWGGGGGGVKVHSCFWWRVCRIPFIISKWNIFEASVLNRSN